MYLPNSTKAAEFLCHEEVMQTLAYAQENKSNLPNWTTMASGLYYVLRFIFPTTA